jgi:NADPH:quinone reductase-like Zn-dependent oxidoreductase
VVFFFTQNVPLPRMKSALSPARNTVPTPTVFTTTEVILPGAVEPSGLLLRTRQVSALAAGQVLVAMEASGVSFAEQAMRRDRYPGMPKFPFVPGYDLVGTVVAVGPGVAAELISQRVAALTKTGGWATYATLAAADLLPVPAGTDPAAAETLIVNGITAWQMLHRKARIQRGQTVLVHGANGGVGTVLVQLAQLAGVRVIGTAAPRHHAALRAQGVEPLDYAAPDLTQQVRQLAPGGVDAAFDHVGGASVSRSFRLLAPGGTLVSYAVAGELRGKRSVVVQFCGLLLRLLWLNSTSRGRKAGFYNIWSGKSSMAFRTHLREDFTQLMQLLGQGQLTPQIAARFPLAQISQAMELAESHTAYGKVVILPGQP